MIQGTCCRFLIISGSKAKSIEQNEDKWGARFLKGMSGFQIFLGVFCVLIGFAGFAAAFDAKYQLTKDTMSDTMVCIHWLSNDKEVACIM